MNMNNQNEEIKLGDLVSIDENGYVVKATTGNKTLLGTFADTYGHHVTVNLGVAVASVTKILEPILCVICKRSDHTLPPDYQYRGLKFDHPFLKDNLELLEWKYAQSIKI